jgi:hypothetical protein
MKPFFIPIAIRSIALATEAKNGKIRMRNAKFVGKRLAQDEFIDIKGNGAFCRTLRQ